MSANLYITKKIISNSISNRTIWIINLKTSNYLSTAEIAPLLEPGFGLDFYESFSKLNLDYTSTNIHDFQDLLINSFEETLVTIIKHINSMKISEEAWLNYTLEDLLLHLKQNSINLYKFPSILFAIECLLFELKSKELLFYNSNFANQTDGIAINGLIQINNNITSKIIDLNKNYGITCFKIKIDSNDSTRLKELKLIRKQYPNFLFRLDLNLNLKFISEEIIDLLIDIDPEYIEQATSFNSDLIAKLRSNKIKLAIDEELLPQYHSKQFRLYNLTEKNNLLKQYKPDVLVIKPTNLGGFRETMEWIDAACYLNINKIVLSSTMESKLSHARIMDFISYYQETKRTLSSFHGLSTYNYYSSYENLLLEQSNQNGKIYYKGYN